MLAAPGSAVALALLGLALLAAPGRAPVRHRLRQLAGTRHAAVSSAAVPPRPPAWLPALAGLGAASVGWAAVGGAAGVLVASAVGVAAVVACRRILARGQASAPDPLQLAGACDLLAACLRAGLAVEHAARAVAGYLPDTVGAELRRAAELLALGADPDTAWRPCAGLPVIAKVARAARRSSTSGADLARVAAAAADDARAEAADTAEAAAQRAGVLVAGPLGVCFLPAFLCLGVIPVVIGLADGLLTPW